MKTDIGMWENTTESCGKVSFSRANAEMHAASRREEKRLKCMNCGKKFASQTYLNRHIRREMGIGKTFNCGTCDQKFSKKSDLQDHLSTHTQTARHRCEECGKTAQACRGTERQNTTNKRLECSISHTVFSA